MSSIDNQITEALNHTPLSRGDNLDGFRIDVGHYLSALGLFENFSVKKTGNARCSLLATGRIRDEKKSPEDVAQVLEEVWLRSLRCAHWEAHSLEVSDDSATLIFVTTSGVEPHDLSVTGKIVISGWRS